MNFLVRGGFVILMATAMTGCATSAPRVGPASSPEESSQPADEHPRLPQAALPPAPAQGCEARIGADRLRRSAVKRTVDAGLGRWLQEVSVDPLLARGRFKGWIIRALPADDECYLGVDLRAGDVVTRVNGRSIERPEEALAVWVGLPASSELVVDLLRDGRARTLRLGIVDR